MFSCNSLSINIVLEYSLDKSQARFNAKLSFNVTLLTSTLFRNKHSMICHHLSSQWSSKKLHASASRACKHRKDVLLYVWLMFILTTISIRSMTLLIFELKYSCLNDSRNSVSPYLFIILASTSLFKSRWISLQQLVAIALKREKFTRTSTS